MDKPNVLAESDAPPQKGASADQQQTVEIPLTVFPAPPKPGAMVQLKVISVDAQNGVVNAALAPAESPGGSDSLASEFDKPTM